MRTCASRTAESRKVKVSRTNAGYMPKMPEKSPPRAAPRASITDQVAELSALTAPSSRGLEMSGRMAVWAGSKKPVIAI